MSSIASSHMPEIDVDRIEPLRDVSEWDRFVESAPGATFCHDSAWLEIMTGVLGHECAYQVARAPDGQVIAVLPLVHVEARPLGRYLVSMPFLNSGGPLGPPEARSALAAWAGSEARKRRVDLLEVRCREPLDTDLRKTDRKVSVVLELPDDPDVLWQDVLPSKVRSQIRRPLKEGLQSRFGPDQSEAFYPVFARHMRDLGTPVLPQALFDEIRDRFGEAVEFGAVYAGDRPVAVGCGFVWNETFEITWASALREYSRSAPNMLLYWSFMERMVARGVRRFDFGRCTPGSGTHRFKRQWGGSDLPLPWRQWAKGALSATPTPDRQSLKLASRAWRRLPVPIANRLGPLLARRLP